MTRGLAQSVVNLCLLLSALANAEVLQPQPFQANYKANFSGFSVSAQRSLTTLADGQQEFVFSANSMFANIDERSRFTWTQSGQLVPLQYRYRRSGLGRDRQAQLDFDWQTMTVLNNVQHKPWSMAVVDATLDKLSYQLQLRSDLLNDNGGTMEYQIADGGRLKTYAFATVADEQLATPLGPLNTVKIARIRKDTKRVTHLWLAKDWDYLIVRIQQQEKGGQTYEIELASATLNGVTVTGL